MILKVHTRGMPLASDVDLKYIAASTPSLFCAGLRNLANEVTLLAARRNRESIRHKDMPDALETLVLGPERALVKISGALQERTRSRPTTKAVTRSWECSCRGRIRSIESRSCRTAWLWE